MPRSSVITAIVKETEEPAFSPTDVSGLQLWLDASDTSTITESSGAVSQWDDKSGNGNHVTQTTPANQPVTGTRTINSLNVLDFDGSSSYLEGSNTQLINSSTGQYTAFAVVQKDTTAVGIIIAQHNTTAKIVQFLKAGVNAVSLVFNTSNTPISDSSNFAAGTSPVVISGRFNGSEIETLVNQQTPGGTSFSGSPKTSAINFTIGNIAPEVSSEWFDGVIGEILIYDNALSNETRVSVESYLANKWGVTFS